MTPVTTFAGRKVALFGLGGSGFATAEALRAGGALASVWDDSAAARERARAEGHTVADLKTCDWSRFAALILSPGVPLTHPEPHWTVAYARTAGIEVIGDVELFCRERARLAPRAPFFAITGTNGKSTTTALLAHLLRFFGQTVEMGGNIGTPILALAPPADDRCHVIELSTFQIDLTPSLRPSVGILLNLTPDHIDRHGTMERYAAIKERLVARADRAVIAVDDPYCAAIADRLQAQGRAVTRVATTGVPLLDGIALEGTRLIRHTSGRAPELLADLAGLRNLRGRHNAQNAAAAVAAVGPALPNDAYEPGARFPSPLAGEGGSRRRRAPDEGSYDLAAGRDPSSAPSGHLLPQGEKGRPGPVASAPEGETLPPPPSRGRWHGEAVTEGVLLRPTNPTPRPSGGTLPGTGREGAPDAGVTIKAGGMEETLREALRWFTGLAHRMEQVGQRGRVLFINDSKATNADAAEQSLKAFRDIFWIAGGVAKDGGIAPLRPLFGRVAKAYLIGKAAADFAAQLGEAVPNQTCSTLEAAVEAAASDAAQSAAEEPVVLLAPACASYDQFKNFEERGERFRSLVEALPREERP